MEELIPWFRVSRVPGLGNRTFRLLLGRFGHPERILSAGEKELLGLEGVKPAVARALGRKQDEGWIRDELSRVRDRGARIVTLLDPEYPPLLTHIPDPPPYLYVLGRLSGKAPHLAVVGSRNATQYGLTATRDLAEGLARAGVTVVSGMARGIDTAAHEGALAGGGETVAVMGCGLETVYPRENRELFGAIAGSGAVISEFPMETPPEGHNFPRRNRIISGLSLGVVVVEAAARSGSLITARLAAEQNREVFAVPGSVTSFKSTGTHGLIKEGAALVENAEDVLEHLSGMFAFGPPEPSISRPRPPEKKGKTKRPSGLSGDQDRVYQALDPYPVHIDELVRKLAMEPGPLLSVLLELELLGLAIQSPGKLFQKV